MVICGIYHGPTPTKLAHAAFDVVLISSLPCIGGAWEVSQFVSGHVCSIYMDERGEFTVCSKTGMVKQYSGSVYWQATQCIQKILAHADLHNVLIRGVITERNEFLAFGVYNIAAASWVMPFQRRLLCKKLGIPHVPVIVPVFDASTLCVFRFSQPLVFTHIQKPQQCIAK